MLFMNKRREPEVYGLRLNCTNKKVVATILLLCDILKPVNMLSLYLQEEHVNFTSLPKHVKITTDSLHAVIQKYEGNDWDDVEFAKSEQIFQEIDDRTDLGRQMRGDQQALDPRTFLQETGIPLIYDLIQEIEDAFCIGAPVLSAFAILNPDNLPDTVGELKEYGNNHIQTLVDFYGSRKEDTFMGHTIQMPALMDPLLLKTELESFKTHLFMLSD
ncbi:uncharacterized protein LOC117324822 [Pecten maximus]|uniref:uncharacterized protein LOC117324822 n=1 Tax=Pecten maximus TaxID=6579 RepID=UPI0014582B9A|nr:uncharacterized protein LOC117324822 [Pecten maximus]